MAAALDLADWSIPRPGALKISRKAKLMFWVANMATRGTRPKPSRLRIVDGTHRPTRHGDLDSLKRWAAAAVRSFGTPMPPKSFSGAALAAWQRYIEPAGWLDAAREPAAIAFCELWQEFHLAPNGFPAAKHGQLRAYMSDLGLSARGPAKSGPWPLAAGAPTAKTETVRI